MRHHQPAQTASKGINPKIKKMFSLGLHASTLTYALWVNQTPWHTTKLFQLMSCSDRSLGGTCPLQSENHSFRSNWMKWRSYEDPIHCKAAAWITTGLECVMIAGKKKGNGWTRKTEPMWRSWGVSESLNHSNPWVAIVSLRFNVPFIKRGVSKDINSKNEEVSQK